MTSNGRGEDYSVEFKKSSCYTSSSYRPTRLFVFGLLALFMLRCTVLYMLILLS